MTTGLEKTLKFLTDTTNEAAVSLLLAGLDSSDRQVQEGMLRALLERRRGLGQGELVRRWGQLNKRWKLMIAQHPRQIAGAVRDAVLSENEELCGNGCDALLHIREYELIPTLVTAAVQTRNPQSPRVARTLLQLAELLYEEISGPRDTRRRQDPNRARTQVLGSLRDAMVRYRAGQPRELVEAFLLLVPHDDQVLTSILDDQRHPTYGLVSEILNHSTRLGIIRLILNCLESRRSASLVLQVISRRRDLLFVRQAVKRIGPDPPRVVRINLRRLESIEWLQHDLQLLDALTDREQESAVALAVHSGMNRLRVFDVVKYLAAQGETLARRAAASALAEFGGVDANQLALAGLEDPDPQVEARMARQLRERGIPGAITKLISLLDSPHEVVRSAAKSSLSEFNFMRFLAMFDMIDDATRKTTGRLVMQVDDQAVTELVNELKAKTRTRRIRGLEVATAMDAVKYVEPLVVGLVGDKDHFVRAEAARALGHCPTPLARQALQSCLKDRSVAVRDAAEEALRHHTSQVADPGVAWPADGLPMIEQNPLIVDPAPGSVS